MKQKTKKELLVLSEGDFRKEYAELITNLRETVTMIGLHFRPVPGGPTMLNSEICIETGESSLDGYVRQEGIEKKYLNRLNKVATMRKIKFSPEEKEYGVYAQKLKR